MLQQVARLGRLGSLVLPSPTMGNSDSTINPAMILYEYNTLNPETFRLGGLLLALRRSLVGFASENQWISLETAPERLVSRGERAAAFRQPKS